VCTGAQEKEQKTECIPGFQEKEFQVEYSGGFLKDVPLLQGMIGEVVYFWLSLASVSLSFTHRGRLSHMCAPAG